MNVKESFSKGSEMNQVGLVLFGKYWSGISTRWHSCAWRSGSSHSPRPAPPPIFRHSLLISTVTMETSKVTQRESPPYFFPSKEWVSCSYFCSMRYGWPSNWSEIVVVFCSHWEVMLYEVCTQIRQDHDNCYFDLGKNPGWVEFFYREIPYRTWSGMWLVGLSGSECPSNNQKLLNTLYWYYLS